MCGIAGLVGAFVPGLMHQMNRVQRHRGPDGEGVFEDTRSAVGLAHVRLAILDLSAAAAQPMQSADGRFVLVYNGELFNYRELRSELEREGRRFRSSGDTEVLLQAWERFGPAVLPRLNGMFAFAVWDRKEQELTLVRDQFGVKPLYYHQFPDGALLFASELKALCAHPRFERSLDPVALQQHLAFGHACGNRTALRGAQRLGPATSLRWSARSRRCDIRTYWQPERSTDRRGNRADAVDELRQRLQQAVRRQLVSDVPLGVALSGGLDSSLLTAAAASASPTRRLNGFTIASTTADNRIDQMPPDLPFARIMARHCGVELHEIVLEVEHAELWPRLLYHLDEPIVDPAIISCYLVCAAARRQGITVLLSGQGADELLAGYPRYRAWAWTTASERWPRPLREALAGMGSWLPGAWPGALGGALRRGRRLLHGLPLSADERFLHYAAGNSESVIASVLSRALRAELHACRPLDECRDHLARCGYESLDAYLDRDQRVYLPNHNLAYTDRTSMAVGVECRVPFLDLELAEFVNRLPAEWKLQGSTPKAILREAARGLVPESVISRPKAGFTAPYRTWLAAEGTDLWDELMTAETIRRRGWFDAQALAALRKASLRGQADHYLLQWAVMTLEYWAREFLDANPAQREHSPLPSRVDRRQCTLAAA
uniref:asparagine synthase (glutamine-hydrolyzing) n=1 Tax=Schlesneria paludicola TaxID=360056 RepID=A0A7C4LNJ7_9PLAN